MFIGWQIVVRDSARVLRQIAYIMVKDRWV